MKKAKKFVICSDIHGDEQDPAAVASLHAFCDDFKPSIRVLAGDLWDFRNLRKGASDDEKAHSLEDDWQAGMEFADRLFKGGAENHFLRGNHDERLWMFRDSATGLVRDYAADGIKRVEGAVKRWKAKMLPYDSRHGVLKLGHLTVIHGYHAGAGAAQAHARVYGNCVFGHCFDEDTQILTERGWLGRDQLSCTDLVATMNLKTKRMEWNKINSFSDYDHYKRLHRIKGQNTDLLVTDGHGLIDFEGKTPRLFKAKDFDQRARTKFRLAGLMERDGIEYSDLQIRLIVQVAADGSLENNGKAVRFHLKKKRKIDRLEALLKDLGIPYSINPSKTGTVKIYFPLTDNAWFLSEVFEPRNKRLPAFIARCNKHQADIVIEEYSLTDGTRYGGCVQICSSKKDEMDTLQAMCALADMRSNLAVRTSGYILSVNTLSNSITINKNNHTTEEYEGRVWCISVDNGTLVARRNGKVTITQNTHSVEVNAIASLEPEEARGIGCLCKKDMPYINAKTGKLRWSQGWAYGLLFDDGTYHLEQARKIGDSFVCADNFKAY